MGILVEYVRYSYLETHQLHMRTRTKWTKCGAEVIPALPNRIGHDVLGLVFSKCVATLKPPLQHLRTATMYDKNPQGIGLIVQKKNVILQRPHTHSSHHLPEKGLRPETRRRLS